MIISLLIHGGMVLVAALILGSLGFWLRRFGAFGLVLNLLPLLMLAVGIIHIFSAAHPQLFRNTMLIHIAAPAILLFALTRVLPERFLDWADYVFYFTGLAALLVLGLSYFPEYLYMFYPGQLAHTLGA